MVFVHSVWLQHLERAMKRAKGKDTKKVNYSAWLEMVTTFSSMHGFAWYRRVQSMQVKAALVVVILVLLSVLPALVIIKSLDFYCNIKVTTSINYNQAEMSTGGGLGMHPSRIILN